MRSASAPAPVSAVRLRDVSELGLTRSKVRTRGWERISQGWHAPADAERSLADRSRLMVPVLPDGSGFGHLTAAALRGWWLPLGLPDHAVMASTAGSLHVQRDGLYVRRSHFTVVELVEGLPLVTAPETLLALGQDLTLVDLVPMVDCALATGATVEEILAAARPRSRGSVVLRKAVAFADPRSESWWESVLRLMHLVAGLGPVECQVDVVGEHGLIARADLHLVGTSRFPECDGGDHRSRERHAKDLRRDKAMSRLGAERYGYTTEEIARQPHLIIRDAEDARGLQHDPDRVARWWAVARSSSLTAHGRTRLAARLDRYRLAAQR